MRKYIEPSTDVILFASADKIMVSIGLPGSPTMGSPAPARGGADIGSLGPSY